MYNTGLSYGGPASIVYGWFWASGFTMLVGLSMAEICSAYPTIQLLVGYITGVPNLLALIGLLLPPGLLASNMFHLDFFPLLLLFCLARVCF